MAETLGKANALRYRGYVYDTETSLYYLQSRYYNPGTGRFINADVFISTGQGLLGNNMFAYCGNNPINYEDPTGEFMVDWDLMPNQQAGEKYARDLLEQKEAIESGEVTYSDKGKNGGAEIRNSYKVRSFWLMYAFVSENRGDEVSGTTLGVMFERFAHNAAYDYGMIINDSDMIARAEDVYFGNTIWDDDHPGNMSNLMKLAYILLFPFHAEVDLQIHNSTHIGGGCR